MLASNYTIFNAITPGHNMLSPIEHMFTHWPGGGIGSSLFHLNLQQAIASMFTGTFGAFLFGILFSSAVFVAWVYSREPEFVAIWGMILWLGFRDFFTAGEQALTVLNSIMVPFAFIISMLYIRKIMRLFGGG